MPVPTSVAASHLPITLASSAQLAKGLNLKGLSVEDAMKVDAYARNLREGRDQKPFDERAYDLFQQNKHLKKQLEEKEVEVASLVTRLRRSRGKGAAPHFDADDELGPISMGADGGGEVATSQVLEGMQRMMADMKREYNAKMEAMSKVRGCTWVGALTVDYPQSSHRFFDSPIPPTPSTRRSVTPKPSSGRWDPGRRLPRVWDGPSPSASPCKTGSCRRPWPRWLSRARRHRRSSRCVEPASGATHVALL